MNFALVFCLACVISHFMLIFLYVLRKLNFAKSSYITFTAYKLVLTPATPHLFESAKFNYFLILINEKSIFLTLSV